MTLNRLYSLAPLAMSFAAFLAGCAAQTNPFDPYMGQNIQTVVAKIGYPSGKRQILSHTIYQWNFGSPFEFHCSLEAAVDNNDKKIERLNSEGNHGGCDALDDRLR